MLNGFVWFSNSEMMINMNKVLDFVLKSNPTRLEFLYGGGEGRVVKDKVDIHNFLMNVARLDVLPNILQVTQSVTTVEEGASIVGVKLDRIG